MNPCAFGTTDPLYIQYHNEFWGKPLYDSQQLFELLALESQHAGLSWLIILKKKEAYQNAFHQFNPYKVAEMSDEDIDALMDFPNIVHHRKKLEAIVAQARGYIKIENEHGNFSEFLWSFVDGSPIDFRFESVDERITVNETAKQLSKALKQYGFKFIGPVTTFSFMEAAGMYNSHLVSCPHRHA
ncbi:DNA-3-methyladenine glycosylase I [Staphylococcus muscae]|uniref:DNA-3-methyladenine glycosylase I n=1 Tax=Staphylococcus muscae TaxID=1294 RepID=A0A240C2T4_9STAP|nr:DNA-3-methyladenine glycosylase I [Staphylococcus muscae]AVQ32966.1 DNA-3-methyladenine glycosylase I [Staphylococcus muscae]PNZ05121.1 DNA-3-methyladenine glycosylase I [Staphylococcus muscae]GGA89386.1 DNA-3-methyladenine glycosylase I [Staphylococcus muscae]SNW02215.1 DNA-3-methyladenine glycosylase I [Staphylococcus muscae]